MQTTPNSFTREQWAELFQATFPNTPITPQALQAFIEKTCKPVTKGFLNLL